MTQHASQGGWSGGPRQKAASCNHGKWRDGQGAFVSSQHRAITPPPAVMTHINPEAAHGLKNREREACLEQEGGSAPRTRLSCHR